MITLFLDVSAYVLNTGRGSYPSVVVTPHPLRVHFSSSVSLLWDGLFSRKLFDNFKIITLNLFSLHRVIHGSSIILKEVVTEIVQSRRCQERF